MKSRLRLWLGATVVALAACSSSSDDSSGSAGASGSGGNTGTSGSSGSSGAGTGSSGTYGGTSGATGTNSGSSGSTGATGTTGAAGTTGSTGTSGESGASGTSGASGKSGASGTSGSTTGSRDGGTSGSTTGSHDAGTGVHDAASSGSSASTTTGDGGACVPGPAWTGGTTHTGTYGTGTADGSYSWNLYAAGGGSDSITVAGTDALFSAMWANAGDFIARVGLSFNSTMTPTQIGTLEADFAETKTGTGGGYSNIGIYGWTENPLHEYYIVDDWFGNGPPVSGTKAGSFEVDGDTYVVYQHTQNNQPAITGGNATFVQFLSVRQHARQCGHISISQHFAEWATLGLQMGNLEEARILVEAGGGTGSINFTTATVTLTSN
jgi:hypothetical protein